MDDSSSGKKSSGRRQDAFRGCYKLLAAVCKRGLRAAGCAAAACVVCVDAGCVAAAHTGRHCRSCLHATSRSGPCWMHAVGALQGSRCPHAACSVVTQVASKELHLQPVEQDQHAVAEGHLQG